MRTLRRPTLTMTTVHSHRERQELLELPELLDAGLLEPPDSPEPPELLEPLDPFELPELPEPFELLLSDEPDELDEAESLLAFSLVAVVADDSVLSEEPARLSVR